MKSEKCLDARKVDKWTGSIIDRDHELRDRLGM
jgi:hypothetical protein